MYITKDECLHKLYESQLSFRGILNIKPNGTDCEFKLVPKAETDKDKMVVMLLHACTGACFHYDFIKEFSFVGAFHKNEDNIEISEVNVIVQRMDNAYAKINLNASVVLEGYADFERILEGADVSEPAKEAFEMIRKVGITQLLNFMYLVEWQGLYESDNGYGFSIDYGDDQKIDALGLTPENLPFQLKMGEDNDEQDFSDDFDER